MFYCLRIEAANKLLKGVHPSHGWIPDFVNIGMIAFPHFFFFSFSETVCRWVSAITWQRTGQRGADAVQMFPHYDHNS